MASMVSYVRELPVQPLVVGAIGGIMLGIIITRLNSRSKAKGSKTKRKPRVDGEARMKLYHMPLWKSSRAFWMIQELGLEDQCDVIHHNSYKVEGEERASYKQHVHPNGFIPALRTPSGDVVLESAAICLYLARAHNNLLPPADMVQHYYSLGVYAVATMDPLLSTLHFQLVRTTPEDRDAELVERTEGRLQEALGFINSHLSAGNQYLCGDSFTAADVIVGYAIMWASVYKGGQRLASHPHLQDYLRKLKARPHFSSAVGSLRDWVQAFST